MEHGQAALQRGGVGDEGEVLGLLRVVGAEQGAAGLAAGHDVAVVAEDGEALGGEGARGDVQRDGEEFAGPFVEVGQHEQEALRGGEGGGEGAAEQAAVDRAGHAALGLELHDLRHLAPDVGAAGGGPFVAGLGHRGGRRDRVDGDELAQPVRDGGDGLVGVAGDIARRGRGGEFRGDGDERNGGSGGGHGGGIVHGEKPSQAMPVSMPKYAQNGCAGLGQGDADIGGVGPGPGGAGSGRRDLVQRTQGGAVDPARRDERGGGRLGLAELVFHHLLGQHLHGATAEGVRSQIEAGAAGDLGRGAQGAKAMGLADDRAGGAHPVPDLGPVGEHDIKRVVAEPGLEARVVVGVKHEGTWWRGVDVEARLAEEKPVVGGRPAVQVAGAEGGVEGEAGAAVTERADLSESGDHAAVVVGADGVESRVVGDAVGVDAGEARPVDAAQVGIGDAGEHEHALDAAGLEHIGEAFEGVAGAVHHDLVYFKTLSFGLLFRARHEPGVVAGGVIVAGARAIAIEQDERAPEGAAARATHLAHQGAGEGIAPVAERLGGLDNAQAGGGFHARAAAQGLRNGGVGELEVFR